MQSEFVSTIMGFGLNLRKGSYLCQYMRDRQAWEPCETKLVNDLVGPGDLCVDGGAHVGYYSCLMGVLGAKVLAFEPNPENYMLLRSNVVNFDVCALQVALSDINGEATFFLPSDYDDGWGSLGCADNSSTARPIQVTTHRLENLLPPGRVRLIKLDVEGAECLAIRGLGERLDDVDYLLVECVDIKPRVDALHSDARGIQELLAGWRIYSGIGGKWNEVQNVRSTSECSFLFENWRIKKLGGRVEALPQLAQV